MISTPNGPTFVHDHLPLHWQMTRCEKYALNALIDAAAPEVAIEVGTYRGGSLQCLSRSARMVYSIDTAEGCAAQLGPNFHNVQFITGDSKRELPLLLDRLATEKASLGFVLIDGDHSESGVLADANALINYVPDRQVYVVFHDSFNPACRSGMLMADWRRSPYVHFVEIDFVPGVYHHEAFDTAKPRSMWGGFAFVMLRPEPRTDDLVINQSQIGLFEAMVMHSCHAEPSLHGT